MKRNLKNSCFAVLGFLLVCNLLSCNNIFIFKKTTQVSFNLNIQGLQDAHQKQSSALNNRAAGGDVSQVIISLYQATDPASISENQQLDTSKLKHLESITPAVAPDGKVLATFNEVTVGITAVIFVEIYETDPTNASQNLAYKGNSSVFTVQEGENNVEIELKKVAAPNQVDSVQFNPATGPVDTGTTVTLFCDTTDAIIYYTTDGSAPTTSSNRYTSTPITITTQTTIKAYAVKSGMTDSFVTERTYSLNQYTVQFVLNGGSFTESGKETSLSVQSGTEVVLKNYQVERSGYEFGGWYYDAAFNTPVEDSGIVTPTQANITLYAKWEAVNTSINQTVTSFSELKTEITKASGTSQDNPYVIGIGANFSTADTAETITVSQHIKLVATGDYTITKTTDFAGVNIFTVETGASLTLGDTNAGGTLTIDGGGTAISTTTKSLINVTGTLVLDEKSVLQNNVCYDNYNSSNGAAVYSSGGNIIINGGTIKDNQLLREGKSGGGIYLENGTFTMTSGSFINNNASTTNGHDIYGGALYIDRSVVSIENARFDSNSVSATDIKCYGGAIYIINSGTESASATISNCSFTNNSAYQRGGAIYTSGASYIEINGCSFENNSITNSTGEGPDVSVGNTSGSTKIDGTQVTGGWTSN